MVRLSEQSKRHIAEVITEAERQTSAEIAIVVAPASDAYSSYVLLYGLLLGSGTATGLWAAKILTAFPLLLAVQIGLIALLSLAPFLRRACIFFVPTRLKHTRSAHRAYGEYLAVSRHVPANVPILLFYVSLAEHYAHIMPSRTVREKIADKEWDNVIAGFAASMKINGLEHAILQATGQMAALLIPHFPPQPGARHVANEVIERR